MQRRNGRAPSYALSICCWSSTLQSFSASASKPGRNSPTARQTLADHEFQGLASLARQGETSERLVLLQYRCFPLFLPPFNLCALSVFTVFAWRSCSQNRCSLSLCQHCSLAFSLSPNGTTMTISCLGPGITGINLPARWMCHCHCWC